MNNKKIVDFLSIDNNIELIGSNAIRKLKYTTDYDYQEIIKIKNIKDYNVILQKFKNIFQEVQDNNNIFITDMKAGSFNTLPVRWNYDDIMNGFKFIDTKLILFVNTLNNNDKVKIDLIVYIKDKFVEVSCNYYFNSIDNIEIIDIQNSLLLDIKKYYYEKKFMKMFKRIMSYRKLINQDNNELINFFNGEAGLLYQSYHKIEVILLMLENFPNTNMKRIINAVKKIVLKIPKKYIKNLINYNDLINSLIDLRIFLNDAINKLVIDFV